MADTMAILGAVIGAVTGIIILIALWFGYKRGDKTRREREARKRG